MARRPPLHRRRRLRDLVATAVAAPALLACAALAPLAPASGADAASSQASTSDSTARPAVLGTASADDDQGLTVAIDALSPEVLTTQSEVHVSGTVTNSTTHTLAAPGLDVFVQPSTPVTEAQLTSFLSGSQWPGWRVATQTLPGDVAAGASEAFDVTVSVADLPLSDSFEWGPRGVTVSASSGGSSGEDRTLLLWDSGYEVAPTVLDTLVPWTSTTPTGTDTPTTTGDAPTTADGAGSDATAPTTLGDTVLSLAQMDGVTLAVDPEVLPATSSGSGSDGSQSGDQSGSQSGDESGEESGAVSGAVSGTQSGAQSGPGTGTEAPSFTQTLMDTATEVVALPRWDADLGAIVLSGQKDLLSLATTSREEVRTPGTSADVLDDVVWPTATGFGREALAAFRGQTVVAPAGSLEPADDLTFTSVTRVEVDATSGATSTSGASNSTTTVLTSQKAISDLLGWQTGSRADDLDARQALAALTAIITREKPNESRTLLATVPRSTPLDQQLTGRVRALVDQRWVSPATFSAVRSSEPTDQKRTTVGAAHPLNEAATSVFRTIADALARIEPLARATDSPDTVLDTLETSALRTLSAGATTAERTHRAAVLDGQVSTLLNSVRAEPSVTINLINKTAEFPVRVRNKLPWAVDVHVTLIPSDPRLQVLRVQDATLPAGSTTSVEVPVRAIGSGNIEVTYLVTTPDGHQLDQRQQVTVRMRAGWEDTATIVIAVLLAVALVGGVARTLRRRLATGGRHVRPEAMADQEEP